MTVADDGDLGQGAVIDASVGLKWVLPEPGAEVALRLRDRLIEAGGPVHVPDLFWAEMANVLWRLTRGGSGGGGHGRGGGRAGSGPLEPVEARSLLEVLRMAPLATVPTGPLAGRALEIACTTGATVYDALYVATAEVRGVPVWTADERLVRSVAGSEWEDRVRAVV